MADQLQEEVAVEVGGQKFNYKGMHLGNLLQICMVAAMVYGAYVFLDTRKEQQQEHKVISIALEQQVKTMERQAVAQEEFNYLITLNQTDREKLNLRMPESLRLKLGSFR